MSVRYLIILLLLSSPVLAQSLIGYDGADPIYGTIPTALASLVYSPAKYLWDYSAVGNCYADSQCLVRASFNPNITDPLAYFESSSSERPKCIDSGGYILDHYCDGGEWSSRTRFLADQLLALAYSSGDSFELYCDSYDHVLNRFDYMTDFGFVEQSIRYPWCKINGVSVPCANNFCVLEHEAGVAVGTSLNVPVDDPDHSFLFALNKSEDLCSAVSGAGFSSCGEDVWFDPSLQLVIYSDVSLPSVSANVRAVLPSLYSNLKNYSMDYVHNPPVSDVSFVEYPPLFDRVFVARNDTEFIFSYKQVDYSPASLDYAAWQLSDLDLPGGMCSYFRLRDPSVKCEAQPFASHFFALAYKRPPTSGYSSPYSIVDDWALVGGGFRLR